MNKDEVSCIDDVIEVIRRVKNNYESEYDEVVAELDAVTAQRDAAMAQRDELLAVAERLAQWGQWAVSQFETDGVTGIGSEVVVTPRLTNIIMDANRAINKEQS